MQTQSILGVSPEGFHRVSYASWGRQGMPAVVCVHGLTRNGRDFDWLAQALCDSFQVVCPDMVGRGMSDHLHHGAYYTIPQYINDCTTLIARLGVETVDWIGTSLGGLIGMGMASLNRSPIRRLVLNDVGPFIGADALQYIRTYVQIDPTFTAFEEVCAFFKKNYGEFISQDWPEYWAHLAQHSTRRLGDGRLKLLCDPNVILGLPHAFSQGIDLWSLWDKITCPVLVLRGKKSTLLPEAILLQMKERKPDITIVEFEGVGHAPSLAEDEQIACVESWLMS